MFRVCWVHGVYMNGIGVHIATIWRLRLLHINYGNRSELHIFHDSARTFLDIDIDAALEIILVINIWTIGCDLHFMLVEFAHTRLFWLCPDNGHHFVENVSDIFARGLSILLGSYIL